MPRLKQLTLDLLAIGRVSNLPTVWSNVMLGMLLGGLVTSLPGTRYWLPLQPDGEHFRWTDPGVAILTIVLMLLGSSAAYLCGTFFNDWWDADFDRKHRPERAIPAERIPRDTILTLTIAFAMISALLFLYISPAVGITGVVLLACIFIYTAIHKKTTLGVIPMGLCRSCLYVLGFLTFAEHLNWERIWEDVLQPSNLMNDLVPALVVLQVISMALGIAIYVAGLTMAARYESRPEGFKAPRVLFWFLLFAPALTHTWWWIFHRPPFLQGWHLAIPALIGLVPFLAWTAVALARLRRSIPDYVSRTLAGLCLVDLLALPGIAATIETPWPGVNTYPLLLALIPLALFVFALLLQRVAPAT